MKRTGIFCIVFVFMALAVKPAFGNDARIKKLEKENEALKERVDELEKKYSQETEELKAMIAALREEIRGASESVASPAQKTAERKGVFSTMPRIVLVDETVTNGETGKWRGWHPGSLEKPVVAAPDDFAFKPYVTAIVQGVPNPNQSDDGKFGASYHADLELEKKFGDWGLAFIDLRMGQGDTVMDYLNVFSNVDDNAFDSGSNVRCHKFWYNQYLFQRQLTVGAGKLDATDWFDQNKYANDDTCQFLGELFNNSPLVEWPISTSLGARLHAEPKDLPFLHLDLGYFDGTGDWDNILEHGVYLGQMNLKPAELMDWDRAQWDGNYRFYVWLNTRNHVKLMAPGSTRQKNYGFGLTADQMITDKFGVFARFGWQRPDIIPAPGAGSPATLEYFWSFGGQIDGKIWNRQYDVFGVAVGQIFPSDRYNAAGNPARTEGHIEAYYRYQLNKHLAFSPDVQVIWNPDGSRSKEDPVFIYGVRSHLNF